MPRREYKIRKDDNTMKIFSYITKHFYDKDNTLLNIARRIYGHVVPLRNMSDEGVRIQSLKDSPHVLKDEVYMRLEEALDALGHLCSEGDEKAEFWNDGIGILDCYMYKINHREMDKQTYESLRQTSVEGLLAEIMTKRTEINSMPC